MDEWSVMVDSRSIILEVIFSRMNECKILKNSRLVTILVTNSRGVLHGFCLKREHIRRQQPSPIELAWLQPISLAWILHNFFITASFFVVFCSFYFDAPIGFLVQVLFYSPYYI